MTVDMQPQQSEQSSRKRDSDWVFAVMVVLFAIVVLAQISTEVLPTLAPKHPHLSKVLATLHEYLPLLVLALMLYLIHRFEEGGRKATAFLMTAEGLISELTDLRTGVETMRQEFRNSDIALRGRILFYENKFEEAVDVFRDILKSDKPTGTQDTIIHEWLGRSLYQLQMSSGNRSGTGQNRFLKEAIPHLRIAAERTKNAALFKLLGDAERISGSLDQAAGHLQRALELDEDGELNETEAAWSLTRIGVRQNPDQELQLLHKFISKHAGHAGALSDYVRCLTADNRVDEAIAACNNSIAARNRNLNLYPIRAQALLAKGRDIDITQALKDLEVAKIGNPANYRSYLIEMQYWTDCAFKSSVDAEARANFLEKAILSGKEGLKRVRNPAPLEAAAALAYLAQGNLTEAESFAKRSVEHGPQHPNNYLLLVTTLLASGRFGPVPNATKKMRGIYGRKGYEIYSYLYELIAGIGLRQKIDECTDILRLLARAIRGFPRFAPIRPEWALIRTQVEAHVEAFSQQEIELFQLLKGYLDGSTDNSLFATALERIISATTAAGP